MTQSPDYGSLRDLTSAMPNYALFYSAINAVTAAETAIITQETLATTTKRLGIIRYAD
jgi:hypothetical protein